MKALGCHLLVEFYGCDPQILSDVDQVKKEMEEATRRSGATTTHAGFYAHDPHGVSGIVGIADFHVAIHTRPQYGYAAVDLCMFDEKMDPWRSHDYLKERFKARVSSTTELRRGKFELLSKESDSFPEGFEVSRRSPTRTSPLIKTPSHYFLASGASEGYTPLNAFDGALLDAGIGNTNLVKMSSIVPPHCQRMAPIELPPGALVPVAYASITSDVPGQTISAAVAVALPENPDLNGLIMEYSAKGYKEEIEERVRQMAIEGMKVRGWKIKELQSVASQYTVKKVGAAFAAVVLWD